MATGSGGGSATAEAMVTGPRQGDGDGAMAARGVAEEATAGSVLTQKQQPGGAMATGERRSGQ